MKLKHMKTAALYLIILSLFRLDSTSDILSVSNTNDSGPGSLRQAILDANERTGADSIIFRIPLSDSGYDSLVGAWTVRLEHGLPTLTDDSTCIDGTSQAEYIGQDLNPFGPEIEIVGDRFEYSEAGVFELTSSSCTIRGLVINNAPIAILFTQKLWTRYNRITANYIGLDPTGRFARGNRIGIDMNKQYGENTIGGGNPEDRNIISGNEIGIRLKNTYNQIVIGNDIGPDATGSNGSGNDSCGVLIVNFDDVIIGPHNNISYNVGHGICIFNSGHYSEECNIVNNALFSNGKDGIHVQDLKYWDQVTIDKNSILDNLNGIHVVDGAAIPEIINNTISMNIDSGIMFESQTPLYRENIEDNNIFDNIGYGMYSNIASNSIIARDNWWGHESGPHHPSTNAQGQGNQISDYLIFDHWKTHSVTFSISPGDDIIGSHGSMFDVSFTLQNIGDTADSYDVQVSNAEHWELVPNFLSLPLDPETDAILNIAVQSPVETGPMNKNIISMEALSLLHGGTDLDSLTIISGTRGDVNGDGNINVLDVLWIANFILSIRVSTPYELWAGDCSGDGVINILDALAITNVILGNIPACPE